MNKDKALEHAMAWAIQHIYKINKEAQDLLKNKEMDEATKMERVHGPHGTDYQLLNLILLLKPMVEFAKESYLDRKEFFLWFDEKWSVIQEKKMIEGDCGCKGCRKEDAPKV